MLKVPPVPTYAVILADSFGKLVGLFGDNCFVGSAPDKLQADERSGNRQ